VNALTCAEPRCRRRTSLEEGHRSGGMARGPGERRTSVEDDEHRRRGEGRTVRASRVREAGAMALVALMVVGCGGDDDEAGGSSATEDAAPATTAPERATTTSEARSDEPQPLPSFGDVEGTYVTETMRPTLTFTVGQGGVSSSTSGRTTSHSASSCRRSPTRRTRRCLGFIRLTNTFDDPLLPFSVLASPAERADHIVPVPEDVVAWLQTIPGACRRRCHRDRGRRPSCAAVPGHLRAIRR
jgi:hypothetical protein